MVNVYFISFYFLSIVISITICIYCLFVTNKHPLPVRLIFSIIMSFLYCIYHISITTTSIAIHIPFLLSILLSINFLIFSNLPIQSKFELAIAPNIYITGISIYTNLFISVFLENFPETVNILTRTIVFNIFQTILTAISLIFLIKNTKKKLNENTISNQWSTAVIFIFITIILESIEYVIQSYKSYQFSPYIAVTILTLTVLFILFLTIQKEMDKSIKEREQEKFDNELLKSQLALNKKYLESQEELHILKHDVEHILTTIVETNNSSINDEIVKNLEKISTIAIPLSTGNDNLDTILNIKRDVAEEKGITFICTSNMDENININKDDLNLLMINLIDNAIEHIGEGKRIEVTIKRLQSNLIIKISNSVDSTLPLIGDKYHIPRETENRYGVKTIQKIVSKYNGILDYSQTNNYLTCSVIIPKV